MTGSSDVKDARFITEDFLKSQLENVSLELERKLECKLERKLESKLGFFNKEFNTLIKQNDSFYFEHNLEFKEMRYNKDTYMNMMMSTPFLSLGWIFGFVFFLTQLVMVVLILLEIIKNDSTSDSINGLGLLNIARIKTPVFCHYCVLSPTR